MNAVTRRELPSAAFPFESKYLDVLGSKMHYIDEGEGDPVIFLHGNPTSSYLWRNIIPYVSDQARCIAPDLIGMGKSDHPDIPYRYDDHYRYLCAFIEGLDLGDRLVTLVIHDWGSGLGFRWAHEHADRVRAISFMEGMVKPMARADFPPDLRVMFPIMRTRLMGYLMVSVGNLFLRKMLPDLIHGDVRPEVLAHYRSAFPTIASRKAVEQWPREVPLDGDPSDNYDVVMAYREWLTTTPFPKLMFYGNNGVAIQEPELAWCKEKLANLKVVDLGDAIHFVQETHPDLIGRELATWYDSI
ncbi:MAG: haloalkane dehalogenase [Deltaproteobacteria bacterium]|nr:haloalkane dehalogenase [Deltaproteobacteria bacterium]